jgi:hypothetical protein
MKTKSFVLAITVLLGCLSLALFAPVSTTQAAADYSPTAERTPNPLRETLAPVRETLSALPTPDDTLFENMLIREKLALGNQLTRLELSHTVSESTQAYIDSQKNAGKDTAALESALEAFNQAILDAETANAAAANLLASPAGFDANGQVTDRAEARQTLRSAGQSLRQAHTAITKGTLTLRLAVQAYRAK